jgi:hypothetical protein
MRYAVESNMATSPLPPPIQSQMTLESGYMQRIERRQRLE